MKKILLALALLLAPTLASAQCSGVFPANTICGNNTGSPAVPTAVSFGGAVSGPGTSTLHGLPRWANTIGTLLDDGAGTTISGAYTWGGANTWSAAAVFNSTAAFNGSTNFTSTFQIGGQTFTFPATGTTVGGLATNQTWTGNNTYSTGTVNFTGTTQLNGGAIGTVLTDTNILNNCSISASVAANALTVALKDSAGSNPSAASPCTVSFRNVSATTGTYSQVAVTSSLSITAPSSATLGTANSVPFRVWVIVFNNGGTPVLALFQSITGGLTPTNIGTLSDSALANGTAITSGSTSARTIYSASAITGKAYRILGYLEFSTGQATAGTWATAPDKLQLFGPGIYRPGQVVQTVFVVVTGSTACNVGADIQTALNTAITPNAAANLIRVTADYNFSLGLNGAATLSLSRGAAPTYFTQQNAVVLAGPGTGNVQSPHSFGLDAPGSVSTQTYYVYCRSVSVANATFNAGGTANTTMLLEEIMT